MDLVYDEPFGMFKQVTPVETLQAAIEAKKKDCRFWRMALGRTQGWKRETIQARLDGAQEDLEQLEDRLDRGLYGE